MKKADSAIERKVRWNELPCPVCGAKRALIKIIYGMPSPDFDYSKNISGGCCIFPDSPDISCKNCDWQGQKEDLPNYLPVLRVSKRHKSKIVKVKKKAAVKKVRIILKPKDSLK